jgi:alpha-1,2-mannosyltransferase
MSLARRLAAVAGLAVAAVALVLDAFHPPRHIAIDFHTYEAAALVGTQQGWTHIYDQALVAVAQKQLVPSDYTQPFLSPPPVAWLAAALIHLRFDLAFEAWALVAFAAFAAALAWAAVSHGLVRWVGVVGALAPWWVLYAVNLGQAAPMIAAGLVVGWRLLRDGRDVAAGLALSLILLKPNTAFLVPLVLLAAGRYRAVATWACAALVVGGIAVATLGAHGITTYVGELRSPLPSGVDALTLKGAGAGGALALGLRAVIVSVAAVTAFRLRRETGLVIPIGIVASLLVSPYLHASDLCLLAAAAWMVWEERPAAAWRIPLALAWVLPSPSLYIRGNTPGLTRWPWIELVLLGALIVASWWPLTRWADSRSRAPA